MVQMTISLTSMNANKLLMSVQGFKEFSSDEQVMMSDHNSSDLAKFLYGLPSKESSIWIETSFESLMPYMPVALILSKSTSGVLQFLGDKLVSWSVKEANLLQCHPHKAEILRYLQVVNQVMVECGHSYQDRAQLQQTTIVLRLSSAIAISCNPVRQHRTKHIHTLYHFNKEQERFQYLVRRIGMRCFDTTRNKPGGSDNELLNASSNISILETTVPQKEDTFQVVIDLVKNSSCFKAFTISADVPEIFMQQFCYSIKKVQGTDSHEFLLAKKKCMVNADVFRTILDICLRVEGVNFTNVPDDDTTLAFLIKLGYKGTVDVSEESELEPESVKRKTYSKRRVKKKVILSVDDNIISDDPDTALELGKSINQTEAKEVEAARQVHAAHARIVTESVPESSKKK
ncbi:hypothetical protein Tco_1007550 [Tanacetum coccineum]